MPCTGSGPLGGCAATGGWFIVDLDQDLILDADDALLRIGGPGPDGAAALTPEAFADGTFRVLVGSGTAELKRSEYSTLAALNRLHKASSGGPGWRILGDSFAICMILLGLSGLWMWARGRTPRQMLVSVTAVSATAMIVVLVANLF